MPAQGRVGDDAKVPSDSHGCLACPHTCVGPGVDGSPDVIVNGMPALRVGDPGVHSSCCGGNSWIAEEGAPSVTINGMKAHRLGDAVKHCGGDGELIEGSLNVFVGDAGGGAPFIPTLAFEGAFTLRCEVTGVVLSEIDYVVTTSSGRTIAGRTDEDGRTRLIGTEGAQTLELLLPEFESPCKS